MAIHLHFAAERAPNQRTPRQRFDPIAQRPAFFRNAGGVALDRQRAAAQIPRQPGRDAQILNPGRTGAVQLDAAMQAGLPPLILVFDVRRVRPTDHHGREHVGAAPHMRRQVELGGQPRIFRQTDELAVHVHEQHAVGRADVQHGTAVAPRGRQIERLAVQAGRIVRRRRRRLAAETASRRSCSADSPSPGAPTFPAHGCRTMTSRRDRPPQSPAAPHRANRRGGNATSRRATCATATLRPRARLRQTDTRPAARASAADSSRCTPASPTPAYCRHAA